MNPESHDFQMLLAEADVEFMPPPDFVSCLVLVNSVCAYHYALRSPSGDLELRYRIDSFARLGAGRKVAWAELESDGMERLVSVSLNQMYETNYLAILFSLSEGVFPAPKLFGRKDALELFGSDLAALCFVSLTAKNFSPDYDAACVFGFHKEHVADAYIIGLYKKGSGADIFFDEPPAWRFG